MSTGARPLPDRVVRDPELLDFAAAVGGVEAGPVRVVGGRCQWLVGGTPAPEARELAAPTGVVEFEPAEMTVRARAGTTVEDLAAELAARGQCVSLPRPGPGATVGGVLAVGHSDVRRLGRGPTRDAVLQVRYVSAEGLLVTAGGPTVKNVTGFDLVRLLVGSLGTLGLLAEVILRTRPVPEVEAWFSGEADPFALRRDLYRPLALLWDGQRCWLGLEGHRADVADQAAVASRHGLVAADGPPQLPPHRLSLPPAALRGLVDNGFPAGSGVTAPALPGSFVAEVGVGLVHVHGPVDAPEPAAAVLELNRRLRASFDPTGRLNPGRDPLKAQNG